MLAEDTVAFEPIKAVWEITSACNMCCRHCGSGGGRPLPDELSTKEALNLIDQLADLGIRAITLSGGEPFLRKDWHLIAARLAHYGILTNIVTNGWLMTNTLLERANVAQVSNIVLSLDGIEITHDWIRKRGSYKKTLAAFKMLHRNNIPTACITTLNRKNISDLPAIRSVLIKHGVTRWQIQLAIPIGNLCDDLGLLVAMEDLPSIITFMKKTVEEGKIILHLGDNIGYHSDYGEELLRQGNENIKNRQLNLNFCWQGCHAGKRIIGIMANGDVTGCLAIREPSYIAGNIREQSLKYIWYQSKIMLLLRNLRQTHLQGFCRNCQFGNTCLGGCNAQKVAYSKDIYAENPTCLYRFTMT